MPTLPIEHRPGKATHNRAMCNDGKPEFAALALWDSVSSPTDACAMKSIGQTSGWRGAACGLTMGGAGYRLNACFTGSPD